MSSFTTDTKKVIHQVLEDTSYAYRLACEWEHPNADYADYASTQALHAFRLAFHDENLSHDQLCQILRHASNFERRRQCKTPWAMFMTNFLERHANANYGGH